MTTEQKSNVRVWRVTLDSEAGIMLTPRSLTLVGNENNFIHMDNNSISVSGSKINFATDPMNISKGILFTEQLGFLQMLPSSIVMPLPNLIINTGIGQGMISSLKGPLAVLAVASAGLG
jgi:hypothetical protein